MSPGGGRTGDRGAASAWCLVLCTFERAQRAELALRSALGQEPPPAEIVVVDASADRTAMARITEELAEAFPHVRIELLPAAAPSLPTQRNQGIDATTAPLVMFFDDDAVMHPGCAAELVRVFDLDEDHELLGLEATECGPEPPGLPGQAAPPAREGWKLWVMHKIVGFDPTIQFVPYAGRFVDRPLPASVQHLARRRRLLEGWRMAYRRAAFDVERPDGRVPGAAHMEDYDLSHRVSRHGALARAHRAFAHHARDPDGRQDHRAIVIRTMCNQALLLRTYGERPLRNRLGYVGRSLWRALGSPAREFHDGRPLFVTWRAVVAGLVAARPILRADPDELESTYQAIVTRPEKT